MTSIQLTFGVRLLKAISDGLTMKAIPVRKIDGKLQYDALAMDRLIDNLADGQYIAVFISTAKRTKAQLAFYRGVILPAFAALAASGSYTEDEWHRILTNKFLTYEVADGDEIRLIVRTTSDSGKITADEFSAFLDQCILYGLEEHQIRIPSPSHIGI